MLSFVSGSHCAPSHPKSEYEVDPRLVQGVQADVKAARAVGVSRESGVLSWPHHL